MKRIFITLIFILLGIFAYSQNVVIVVIDGARYSETFGDTSHKYVPKMYELSQQGAIVSTFYNNGYTYTSRAVPALWTGSWTQVEKVTYNGKETQCTVDPTIFEYYRKQKNAPADDCIYTLKYVPSLWLQSFNPEYGEDYWPMTISAGEGDKDVLDTTKKLIDKYHPRLLWVYFADVDHAGHSGDWDYYTSTIKTADSCVYELWQYIQNDPQYKDNTYMFVTNDHGRHDDQHGGFQNHGCSCDGCRHIMYLAMGPHIKKDYVSNVYHTTEDVAVTAAYLLGVNPEYSTGDVVGEIFDNYSSTTEFSERNDFFFTGKDFIVRLSQPAMITMELYDINGKKLASLYNGMVNPGDKHVALPSDIKPGVYIVKMSLPKGKTRTKKIVILK